MTTKADERKVLDQIQALLLTIDPTGYVNTAFEGCVDVARENIENDFACSYKQRAESAEATVEQYQGLAKRNKDLVSEVERLKNVKHEVDRDMTGTLAELDKAKEKLKEYENTILTLKAKLYDYMTREEK